MDEYFHFLKTAYLVPSRKVLSKNVAIYLKAVKDCGIEKLDDLYNNLKTKSRLSEFILKSGIDENYLTLFINE